MKRETCDGCYDIGFVLTERDDLQHAIECCDMCQMMDDAEAARRARARGIACSETYPHVLLDQSPAAIAAALKAMQ